MSIWVALVTIVLLIAVVAIISSPLRVGRVSSTIGEESEDLQIAREAKYREIRDAELDYRTGKLSRADYEAIDRTLRAEALRLLEQTDEQRRSPEPSDG